MTFYSDGDRGTPSISVQAANLWYDIRDTYIVRFVADGCRKNLPLADPRSMKFAPMLAMIDMRGNLIAAAILLVVGVVVFRLVRPPNAVSTSVSYTHLTLPTIYSV